MSDASLAIQRVVAVDAPVASSTSDRFWPAGSGSRAAHPPGGLALDFQRRGFTSSRGKNSRGRHCHFD
jgi:hypothetical protein